MMELSSHRCHTWSLQTFLLYLFLSSSCYASDSTAIVKRESSGAATDPDFWIKDTHSTSCEYNTVRTFVVSSRKGDSLSIIIRQNVKGTIVVREPQKRPGAGHEVQFALNWTTANEAVLAAVQDGHQLMDYGGKKVVLVHVNLGDVQAKTPLSPIVVSGTVSGFLLLMALIIIALYLTRRSDPSKITTPNATPSVSSGGEGDEEDEDTDYYHPSSYMAGSQAPEDVSLNLSTMPELENNTTVDVQTLRSEPASKEKDLTSSLAGSVRVKQIPNKVVEVAELPPPPPPPDEFEYSTVNSTDSMECPTYESIGKTRPKTLSHRHVSDTNTLSSEQITPVTPLTPIYSVPNKNRTSQLAATKEGAIDQTSETESEQSGTTSSTEGKGGGGGSYLGSSMLARTVMIFGLLSVVTQVAYSLCLDEISVQVLILIPTEAKIDSIYLYSNFDKPSVFEHTDWYLQNKKKFMTFDVEDASTAEEEKLCSPKLTCPTAQNRTFLGCDSLSQRCVCKRGWVLNKMQVCVDVDECETGRCPPGMACTNLPGSYSCSCIDGTFWNGKSCQTCTVGCSMGEFEAAPCNSTMDRLCQPCAKCNDGTFTYTPCSGKKDTLCVNVDQPYLQHPNAAKVDTNQVAIKFSPNTFIEELHKPGDLSYPLVVSDNNQIMNFQWNRNSGIRIYVRVSEFNLIPEFHDVQHDDDNSFVQNAMRSKMASLNTVLYNYCRSPIPDYYTLTMNKYKERTTVVKEIVCNTTLKNCPPKFLDGQVYRFRTYNTKCPKTSGEVNRLNNEYNSVVCNERTPLLTDIFNGTISRDTPLTFPSLDCRQSIYRCKECFSTNRCNEVGINESCCAVSCHAQRVCKTAASDECSAAPVECATGDTVQFIVQPVFQNLDKQFLCHLNRKQPESIFKLSYHIVIPTPDGWNSSRREVELPSSGESKATQVSDYITVKYNNYLNTAPDGDMLLRGDQNPMSDEYGFTLFEFKPIAEFNKTKVKPIRYETREHKETTNAAIQNERPFGISTLNFNDEHGCYADTSKIHGKQLMYNNNTAQRVQVYMMKANRGYTYRLRSLEKTPTVDFFLPGNESVLYHYFPNSTLNYNSVSVELVDISEPFYVYSIDINGSMLTCNSYLGISIYDKTTESTVVTYDVLVYCSAATAGLPTFQFQIKIPDIGSKNKLFRVTLRDSHTTVSYYVTTYSYSSSLMQNNTIVLSMTEPTTSSQPSTFFAMLAGLGAIGFAFGLLYILISYRYIIITRFRALEDQCVYIETRRRLLVTLYCVFKLMYSVVFSLTMLVLLLQFVCSSDLEKVRELPSYHIEVKQLVERNIEAITEFKRAEMERQQEMKTERLEACSGYAMKNIRALKLYVDQYSVELKEQKNYIEDKKFELLMTEIQSYLEATRSHVNQHKKDVDSQVQDIMSDYNSLLEEMITNDWLQLPFINYKSIVNKTAPAPTGGLLSAEAVDFLAYIGVDRPSAALHQINILNEQLDMMYEKMIFNIDLNLGLGILRGLDTSSVSMLSLKHFDTEMMIRNPAFAIEEEVKLRTSGGLVVWIIVICCDLLLFIYRICSLTHTVYRLKNGHAEEIEDNTMEKPEKGDNLEVEMHIIKRQIVSEGEMSRSLLEDVEEPDENLNYNHPEEPKKQTSKAPSVTAESVDYTDTEVQRARVDEVGSDSRGRNRQHSRAQSEAGSVAHSDMERPKMRGSEGGSVGKLSKKQRSRIQSEAGGSVQYSDAEQPKAKGSDIGSVGRPGSALSDATSVRVEKLNRPSRNTSRATSAAGSVRKLSNLRTNAATSSSEEGGNTSNHKTSTKTGNSSSQGEENSTTSSTHHPGGCAATKLGKLLLSKYTVPTILWLACQVIAIIIISLLADMITYKSLIQATNIDSMISHVGMYTSVVNSYLTTHAQLVSQTAQETMVQEFNLHLHHIAKVKAILENDLNWSLLDYHNKQCVLDGKLIEHCTYQPFSLDVNVMPCQSFPIEAIQYTEKDGLNTELVSKRMVAFTNSLVSLLTSCICMITFYINAVAIIHIISLLVNKILHHKGFIHIIIVKYSRYAVPVVEPKKKVKRDFVSSPSIMDSEPNTSHHPSDYDRQLHHEAISESSRRSHAADEEDTLLRTIKAQHSLSRQMADDTSEASALLSPNMGRVGGAHSSANQSASETGF